VELQIFIKDLNGMFLFEVNGLFFQAMSKRICMDLFEVSTSEIAMNLEARFAND
jgi:hypothetical protein